MDGNNGYGGVLEANRLESIDVLKGIGILFMMLGHMHFSTAFNHYVYAFHMPLFFLISGYLYKKPKLMVKTIFRKAQSLLTPYFSFGIGYWLLWIILNSKEAEKPFVPLGALVFNGIDGLAYESSLWFLPTLFVVYISFCMIDRKIDLITHKSTLILLLSLFGCRATRMIYTSENIGGGITVLGCL